jgi:preprotein translocase subunit SecG
MGFIIGLLTVFLVLDCIVLVLLVLIQLPKKEAGAGLAFGGAASDALFGAGSGNVLTKITKYAATIFFLMTIFISIVQSRHYTQTSVFQQKLTQPGTAPISGAPTGPAQTTAPTGPAPLASATAAPTGSNNLTSVTQPDTNTNTPAATPNAAAPK